MEHLDKNRKNMKQDRKTKEKGMPVKLNPTDKCPAVRLSVNTDWQAWSWLTARYDDFKTYARPYNQKNTSDVLATTSQAFSFSFQCYA